MLTMTKPRYPRAHYPHSQFEELISSTIEETKDIPEIISETGKIGMPHKGTPSLAADGTSYDSTYSRHHEENWRAVPAQDQYQFSRISTRLTGKSL